MKGNKMTDEKSPIK